MTPTVDPTTLAVVQSVLEQPNVIMTLDHRQNLALTSLYWCKISCE